MKRLLNISMIIWLGLAAVNLHPPSESYTALASNPQELQDDYPVILPNSAVAAIEAFYTPDIQVFLEKQNSVLANYSTAGPYGSMSAAEIIMNASIGMEYQLNPKILLALLETISGLVTAPAASQMQLNQAMGNPGEGLQTFEQQVYWAADTLGGNYEHLVHTLPAGEQHRAGTLAIMELASLLPQETIQKSLLSLQPTNSLISVYNELFGDPLLPVPENVGDTGITAEQYHFMQKPFTDTAVITSYFDHYLPTYGNDPDGIVTIFTDQTGGYSYSGHPGFDYAKGITWYGHPILAVAAGTLANAGERISENMCCVDASCTTKIINSAGAARYVAIDHDLNNDSDPEFRTLYWHLSEITLPRDPITGDWSRDPITKGMRIGSAGNTGQVYPCPTLANPYGGTHLHFEVRSDTTLYNADTNPDPNPYENPLRKLDPYGWWSISRTDPILSLDPDFSFGSRWLWESSDLIDNRDASFQEFAGSWTAVEDVNAYKGDSFYTASQNGWAVWGLQAPHDGGYYVDVLIPDLVSLATYTGDAEYSVYAPTQRSDRGTTFASTTYHINQQDHRGEWVRLTQEPAAEIGLRRGEMILVKIRAALARTTVADAVRLIPHPIDKGLAYLSTRQDAVNGTWSGNLGITCLVTLAYLNAGYSETNPIVQKAMQYILGSVQPSGAICRDCTRATYETSLAMLVIKATHNPAYQTILINARSWLVSSQWDEDGLFGSVSITDWQYGGFGYGNNTRPDLSNTQFAMLAMNAADLPADDPAWDKAEKFVSRCQNRIESNDGFSNDDDGGFIYLPGSSAAGGTLSTGSMTGAGIWGLSLSGNPPEDGRIADGIHWVEQVYTWDVNPTTTDDWGTNSLYYYFLSMSKALSMARTSTLNSIHLGVRDWYLDLYQKLKNAQYPDGRWVSDNNYVWENNPDLATSWALLALQTRRLPVNADLEIAIILHSPADLHLYDAEGRHVGKNYIDGTIDLEIPGAYYTLSEPQTISLTLPTAGNYRLEMAGTSTGDWQLDLLGWQDNSLVSMDVYTGTIAIDQTLATSLNVGAFDGALTIFSLPPTLSPLLGLQPDSLSMVSYQDSTTQANFTILDTAGVDLPVQGVTIQADSPLNSDGIPLGVTVSPAAIAEIPSGTAIPVTVYASAASGQPTGQYTGTLKIETRNAGIKILPLLVNLQEQPRIFLPEVVMKASIGFDSQFNGIADGWVTHSGAWFISMEHYWSQGLPGAWASVSYAVDYTNFDYQVRLQRLDSSGTCGTCSYGVLVRGVPDPLGSMYRWNSGYGFYVNRNGNYAVFKYVNGQFNFLSDWKSHAAIATGDGWNVLRIYAQNGSLSFWINGALVWSGVDYNYLARGRAGVAYYQESSSSGNTLNIDWAALTPVK